MTHIIQVIKSSRGINDVVRDILLRITAVVPNRDTSPLFIESETGNFWVVDNHNLWFQTYWNALRIFEKKKQCFSIG